MEDLFGMDYHLNGHGMGNDAARMTKWLTSRHFFQIFEIINCIIE